MKFWKPKTLALSCLSLPERHLFIEIKHVAKDTGKTIVYQSLLLLKLGKFRNSFFVILIISPNRCRCYKISFEQYFSQERNMNHHINTNLWSFVAQEDALNQC